MVENVSKSNEKTENSNLKIMSQFVFTNGRQPKNCHFFEKTAILFFDNKRILFR